MEILPSVHLQKGLQVYNIQLLTPCFLLSLKFQHSPYFCPNFFFECVNWSFPLGWQSDCLALGSCAVFTSFLGAVFEMFLLGQTMGLSNTLL